MTICSTEKENPIRQNAGKSFADENQTSIYREYIVHKLNSLLDHLLNYATNFQQARRI